MKKSLLFFLLVLTILSCNKETSSVEMLQLRPNSEISEFLGCHGFDVTNMVDYGDYVNVEGDILIEKNALQKMIQNQSLEKKDVFVNEFQDVNAVQSRQYANYLGTLVSMSNVQNIKFYIDNSVSKIPTLGSNWVAAITSACSQWTAILKCRVAFTQVYSHSEANLSFYADNVGSPLPTAMQNMNTTTFVAKSCFPYNGNIGRFIAINDFKYTYKLPELTMAMRHEIGHSLGLRHNNVTNENVIDACTGTYSTNPNLIAGTPQNDPNSIMVSAVNTNNFSSFDLTAVGFMYPDNYSIPLINNIVSSSNGNVTLQMQTISGQLPYRALVLRYNLAGVLQQSTEFLTPSSNTNFTVPCPNGVWNYKVVYANYGSWGTTSSSYMVCNGLFELKRKGTTKCLDADGCGTANGTNVQLWEDNNFDCQRWVISLQTDGHYELKRQNSTKNLDAAGCGSTNGTNVHIWEDNNLDCQRWKITLESDGYFELKRKGTTKNLDAAGCGSTNKTNVHLWEDNNYDCQRWGLTFF